MSIWEDIQGGSDRKVPTTRRRTKNKNLEKKLSWKIAEYLAYQYPELEFRFDIAADMKLTIGQSTISKEKLRHQRGYHDLTILEARGGYFGLLIELKKDRSEVYRQDGKLKKRYNKVTGSDHNIEQYKHLEKMRGKGYWADYGFGFDHTKGIIDGYMANKPT